MSFLKKLFKKKELTITDSTILVLGDSHSRSFSKNDNFSPFFLGAGKENNFLSDENVSRVKTNIDKIIENFKESAIILTLGEPDTRYALGKGWYPWKDQQVGSSSEKKESIDKSYERYVELLKYLNTKYSNEIAVCNITPSKREEQNKFVDEFNLKLKSYCTSNNILFLDINSGIYSNDGSVIKNEYYLDEVHLSTALQKLVEPILLEKGWIGVLRYNNRQNLSNKDLQGLYKFDKRFGCYVLK